MTIAASAALLFASCDKLDEIEGMNDSRAYYSYEAVSYSNDFSYQEAAGPFNAAIKSAVGLEAIEGGADDKVISACNQCYEGLKPKLQGKSGKVSVYKKRHPDGKLKVLKDYKF